MSIIRSCIQHRLRIFGFLCLNTIISGSSAFASRYRIPEVHVQKYNAPEVLCYKVANEAALETLRIKYHNETIPTFLYDFLNTYPGHDWEIAGKHPNSLSWNSAGSLLFQINPEYTSADELEGPLSELKTMPYGLSMIGWYIHPNSLVSSPFRDRHFRKDLKSWLNEITLREDERPSELPKFSDIETSSDPYLVTLLDLNKSHISYLKEAKEVMMRTLKTQYAADPDSDQISLRVHFPYKNTTSTLHIHVRANQGAAPLELTKSYSIDEIIAALRRGETMAQMVMERQRQNGGCIYTTGTGRDVLHNVPGITRTVVPNPFLETQAAS